MTAAEAHVYRLHRLRRRLDDIQVDVGELRRRPSRVELVAVFLRCWAFGHPGDVEPGHGCRRCGAWVPFSVAETAARSAAGVAAARSWEARHLSPCADGGFHAFGDGPCFASIVLAAGYRDRLEQAGVRWLPADMHAAAPIPRRPPIEIAAPMPALTRLTLGEVAS